MTVNQPKAVHNTHTDLIEHAVHVIVSDVSGVVDWRIA
jgi:hypothetical protein